MSALYLLGTGAAFRSCRSLCSISTSEVRKFFYIFLDAIVDMKEEYIYMPRTITELKSVNKSYNAVGLPGCCGSIAHDNLSFYTNGQGISRGVFLDKHRECLKGCGVYVRNHEEEVADTQQWILPA